MLFILFQIICMVYPEVTVTDPSEEALNSYYISAADVGSSCESGLTIKWSTSVSSYDNRILVMSSARGSGNTPVCYKYGGVYYGSGCPACLSSSGTSYPSYPAGSSVTLFIPHIAMVDDGELSSLTTFTLSIGVDGATAEDTSDYDLDDTYDEKTTITVNVDNTAPTGYITAFRIQRGDGAIYVTEFNTSCISETGSGLDRARFYYSECGTEPDRNASPNYTVSINDSLPWVIEGPQNGTSYTVRATVLDKSGNEYDEYDFVVDANGDIFEPVNVEDETSSCVTPTPIVGFLSGDERCFIATALFGGKSDEVLYFRYFRDRYLLNSSTGRFAVGTYYAVSPMLVEIIKNNPLIKIIAEQDLELLYRGLDLCGL